MPLRLPIASRYNFCSPKSKVAEVQRGRSWQTVQKLVNSSYNQEHLKDRFCLTCKLSFSSQKCLDHRLHHPVKERDNLVVLEIVMEDGWSVNVLSLGNNSQ
ncbi:hypothetical protein DAI22_10g030666 [Oryza sativa Japonica Group]|nr:hypothetical protein DAI22_10g030666 [Oryza sativa Japonica Group]